MKKSTMEQIEKLCATETPVAKAYISLFLQPFEASSYVKIDQGHAEIAQSIVTATSAPNKPLNVTENTVCDFGMSCLMHTDATVRHIGMQLIKHMYQLSC